MEADTALFRGLQLFGLEVHTLRVVSTEEKQESWPLKSKLTLFLSWLLDFFPKAKVDFSM